MLKIALAIAIALTLATAHAKKGGNKPEKVLICHYSEVEDELGNAVLDEEGEPLFETSKIRISEKAVQKHYDNHGDVPLETGDEEADAQAAADCFELMADDDDDIDESDDDMDEPVDDEPLEVREISLAPVTDLNGNLRVRSADKDLSDKIANTIHPGILDGRGTGTNANPNDDQAGKHGINNQPGRSGVNPNDDGIPGNANNLGNVHGGLNVVNPNVD